jgi:diguanylate cyclase (GGDEF)-like protein/PAS domain S-box-containing protein
MKDATGKVEKTMEPSLKDSEIRYRRLFEEAQHGILILDAKSGVIIDVNPFLTRMLGYSRNEFVQKKLWQAGAFKDIKTGEDVFDALQKDKCTRYEDLPLRAKDGHLVPVEFVSTSYPVGREKVIQCNIRDNSTHKMAQATRRSGERKLQALVASLEDVIFELDARGTYLNVWTHDERLLPKPRTEMLGRSVSETLGEELGRRVFEASAHVLAGGHAEDIEISLDVISGRRWFLARIGAIPAAGGEAQTLFLLIRDITHLKQAEEASRRLAAIVESSDDAIIGGSIDGMIVSWNKGAQKLYGYSAEEAIGLPISIIVPPDRINELREILSLLYLGKSVERLETVRLSKDGFRRDVTITASPIQDASGEVVAACTIERDFGERKRLDEALHERDRQLRALVSSVDDIIIEMDGDGTYLNIWSGDNSMLVKPKAELLGRPVSEVVGEELGSRIVESCRRVLAGGRPEEIEYPLEVIGGARWFLARISAVPGTDGVAKTVSLLVRDITERKRSEKTLQENEEKFHNLFNNAEIGMFRTRIDGSEILDMNEKFLTIFGHTRAEMLGSTSVLHWADPHEREEMVRRLEANGHVIDFECGMLNKQGQVRRCLTSMRLYQAEGILEGSILDITDRKQTEERLSQDHTLLRTLIDNVPDRIYIKDTQGRKIISNIADWQGSGGKTMEDVLGKSDFDTYPPELAARYWADDRSVLDLGMQIIGREEPGLDSQGNPIWVMSTKVPLRDGNGKITGLVGIGWDITERKRNELVQNAIYRITQAAITSEGINELYHSIHSILGELIPTENFFIALIEPASGEISFPYYVDQVDEPPVGMTPQQGLTGYIIRTGRPLLATRQEIENLVQQSLVERLGSMSVDWMGAPLKVEGRMIGVMAVQSYTDGIHFHQEDLNLLEFVSTQVAQAIERKRMEEEIRNLSLTDELTGLYNRRGFNLLAGQEVKLAHRIKRSMLLLFGDVDNLKTINDTYGHSQGNQALQEISAILKATFRESDLVARIGGDEFVVLAVDASMEKSDVLINRIQSFLEKGNQQGDRPYQLSLSLGIAHYDPEVPFTVSELIAQADGRMYLQKQERHDRRQKTGTGK